MAIKDIFSSNYSEKKKKIIINYSSLQFLIDKYESERNKNRKYITPDTYWYKKF